jgi:hypothetical protein
MRLVQRWCLTPFMQDATAIVVFAVIGMLSHDGAIFAAGFARDALPLLVGWFAVAVIIGTYRHPTRSRLLATWAIGIPLGVLIRGFALGRHLDGSQLAFLTTTLVFSGLLLMAFRALAVVARKRMGPRAGEDAPAAFTHLEL